MDFKKNKSDVLMLACEPIPIVRIAFIGLGKRGKESLNHYMYINNVEIKVICDLVQANIEEAQRLIKKHNNKKADEYKKEDDWKKICERDDIDLIYVCTSWNLHTQIAVHAMKNGKHVAIEIPAATTIKECWELVNAAEEYRRHCIMLENCCYGRFELSILNLLNHGRLGEVTHAEGSYIHDLTNYVDFSKRPEYANLWLTSGNPYPTHGLGPLCQALGIHRGDKLSWLVSVSNGQFNYPNIDDNEYKKMCVLGNINITIIKTIKQKTIVLQNDISSPRPYQRNYLLSGTKGFVHKNDSPFLQLHSYDEFIKLSESELYERFEHPFYKEIGKQAFLFGAHGGMDFIMDYRLIYCLQRGLPLDMDVYDAAEWSSIVELTKISVENGSVPVEIPDFTRGSWNKIKKLEFIT